MNIVTAKKKAVIEAKAVTLSGASLVEFCIIVLVNINTKYIVTKVHKNLATINIGNSIFILCFEMN